MPAWRPRPDWLREAVRSVLDEDSCELELLVVDDGSEEPVAGLLAEIGDPRLRVVRVEHCGPYAARNAGIAEARGDFVRFFDADDVAEPRSTGRLLALAGEEDGEAITYGATLMCDENLVPGQVVTSALEGDVTEACVMGEFEVFVVCLLLPRAVVERAGPWEGAGFTVSGDWDFVLRAVEQAPVRRLGDVVTRYRRHGASVTKAADVQAGARAGELVLERYFTRHPEQIGTALENRAYARMHLDRAAAHAWVGEPWRAVGHLARGARRNPIAAAGAAATWVWPRLRRRIRPGARRARRASRNRA